MNILFEKKYFMIFAGIIFCIFILSSLILFLLGIYFYIRFDKKYKDKLSCEYDAVFGFYKLIFKMQSYWLMVLCSYKWKILENYNLLKFFNSNKYDFQEGVTKLDKKIAYISFIVLVVAVINLLLSSFLGIFKVLFIDKWSIHSLSALPLALVTGYTAYIIQKRVKEARAREKGILKINSDKKK